MKRKNKIFPVMDHGRPQSYEMSRLPNILDIRLTDGGEVVSFMHWLSLTPQEGSWYSHLLEA
jgi:hypothetical protein